MLYTFELYLLISVTVFGFAGLLILSLAVWKEAVDYARALQVMYRISAPASRERLGISRRGSRNLDVGSLHKG